MSRLQHDKRLNSTMERFNKDLDFGNLLYSLNHSCRYLYNNYIDDMALFEIPMYEVTIKVQLGSSWLRVTACRLTYDTVVKERFGLKITPFGIYVQTKDYILKETPIFAVVELLFLFFNRIGTELLTPYITT